MPLLEVCAYNIQSCRVAAAAGAHRIELCADPLEGGITPSFGLIQYALSHISIPVFPMIRPRGGRYVFDDDELAILKRDILNCRELGCAGIATGAALATGRLDTDVMKQIVDWAYPMAVTCHKVFDETPNPYEALEELIAAGCARVLTSGTHKTAMAGAEIIAQLVKQAGDRIIIMPGGSVRSSNLSQLAALTGAKEFHSSGVLAGNNSFISDHDEVAGMMVAMRQTTSAQ